MRGVVGDGIKLLHTAQRALTVWLQANMAEHIAPPPYDEKGGELSALVANMDSYQPSAPPREYFHTPYEQIDSSQDAPRITEERHDDVIAHHTQTKAVTNLMYSYVSYSIANSLRKFIIPKTDEQDPELDVEAQFGRRAVRTAQSAITKRKRMQCFSGWLWCFGVILIPVFIALPIIMIVFGIVGIGECPFRSDTIIVYLIGGGVLFAALVLLRTLPSLLTCIRARNCCLSSSSSTSAKGICSIEVLFYIFLFANFTTLILGTYIVFAEGEPPSCSVDPTLVPNCCDPFVFVSSAAFIVAQYVLYTDLCSCHDVYQKYTVTYLNLLFIVACRGWTLKDGSLKTISGLVVVPPSYDDVVPQEGSIQPLALYLSQITIGSQPLLTSLQ